MSGAECVAKSFPRLSRTVIFSVESLLPGQPLCSVVMSDKGGRGCTSGQGLRGGKSRGRVLAVRARAVLKTPLQSLLAEDHQSCEALLVGEWLAKRPVSRFQQVVPL